KDESTVWSTICWYHAFSCSSSGNGPRCTARAGASVPPGAAATTRTLWCAASCASAETIALTPPLAAAYGTRLIPPVAVDDTLTISPCSERESSFEEFPIKAGRTARHIHRVGKRERLISFSISSGV